MSMTKIHISLLPAEMKRQSSIMKIWTIVAMVLMIIAMILLAGNILLSLYIKEPVAELERLKVEQQSITQNIGRLAYIKEMFDEIDANNADIDRLRGVNPDWAYVMEITTGNSGLYGIKVNRMDIAISGDAQGCILSCWTKDIDNISRWVESFDEIDAIGYVQVRDIITNVFPGNELEFQFNAVIGIDNWNKE